IFEGELTNDFFKEVEKIFKFTKRFRPKAVVKRSKEFYIIGKGFIDN
ncbi:MAG TPA: RlmE family RNA methyltransferase, partial [Candidatus Paceibacterota bacterium]|nr:RlmE family RNA methyltransferase [Candidatus Paceibacterota bacterium]